MFSANKIGLVVRIGVCEISGDIPEIFRRPEHDIQGGFDASAELLVLAVWSKFLTFLLIV
jgi:hypothetical protein